MSNEYIQNYCEELSVLSVFKANYFFIEDGIDLAKSLINPLYYKWEYELTKEYLTAQEDRRYDTINYHEMQAALLKKYKDFKEFSDAEWAEWIIRSSERLKRKKRLSLHSKFRSQKISTFERENIGCSKLSNENTRIVDLFEEDSLCEEDDLKFYSNDNFEKNQIDIVKKSSELKKIFLILGIMSEIAV